MVSPRTTVVLTIGLLTSAAYAQAPATRIAKPSTVKQQMVEEIVTVPAVDESEHTIKIRVINSSDAMQLTEFGKQEAQKIDALGRELKETIDKKEQLLTQTMTDFKAKATTLAPAAREKEESKMIAMRRDLESTGQASDEQYKHAVQRATEKLSKEIEQAVTKIAQDQEIDLVLDLYTGRPVFASEKMMVTKDIVEAMNANFAKTQKAPAKKQVAATTGTAKAKTV